MVFVTTKLFIDKACRIVLPKPLRDKLQLSRATLFSWTALVSRLPCVRCAAGSPSARNAAFGCLIAANLWQIQRSTKPCAAYAANVATEICPLEIRNDFNRFDLRPLKKVMTP